MTDLLDPAPAIVDAHALALNTLPFADDRDVVAAERGFLGTLDPLVITDADGGVVWINVSVSRLGQGDAAVLVLSARLLCRHAETESVHSYWRMARMFLQAVSGSKRAFGPALAGNPACEILLIAYLAEAEASSVTAAELAKRISTSQALANRWILALIDAGFAEMEAPGALGPQTPIRLSPLALSQIEALFSSLGSELKGMRVPA